MVWSLVFVRSYSFGWSPVYDCKAYLETNTVKNCSYFGFGEYFLVTGRKILPVMNELSLKYLFSQMTGNKPRVRALRERAPCVCLE